MELTASDEGIPTEGMVQNQSWPMRPKMMLIVWLTVILVAVIPNPPNTQWQHCRSCWTWSAVRTTKLCILIYVATPI